MKTDLQTPSVEGSIIVGYCKYGGHPIYGDEPKPYTSVTGALVCVAHIESEAGFVRSNRLFRISLLELIIKFLIFVIKNSRREPAVREVRACDARHANTVGLCGECGNEILERRNPDKPAFVPLGPNATKVCMRCLIKILDKLRAPHQ